MPTNNNSIPSQGFNLGKGLSSLADTIDAGRERKFYNEMMAANPQFAQQYFGGLGEIADQKQGAMRAQLFKENVERERAQKEGLKELANRIGGGETDLEKGLAEYGVITGDLGGLIDYKTKRELASSPAGMGATGALAATLIQEPGNGIDTYAQALQAIKGGAGAIGRLGAEIELGNEASYETRSGTNRSDEEYKPRITQAQNQAGQVGTSRGEAQAKLESMTANMPKLYNMVEKLDKLSDDATYTLAGKGIDAIAGQVGLETGGGTARAEYIATVNNAILPLLKETFGAAFTVQEGAELKATLGDPDASPRKKQAKLKAFIEAKVSEIESLNNRTGVQSPSPIQNGTISLEDFLNE